MDEQIEKLKIRFSEITDEELLKIISLEKEDYRPEAMELAIDEIDRRGIDRGATFIENKESEKVVSGIRGWLLFVVIILIFNVVMDLNFKYKGIVSTMFSLEGRILSSTKSYFYFLNIAEDIGNFIMAVFALALIKFTFSKKRIVPKLATLYFGLHCLNFLVIQTTMLYLSGRWKAIFIFYIVDFIIEAFFCVIGIIYFKKSKRVKNTFVR